VSDLQNLNIIAIISSEFDFLDLRLGRAAARPPLGVASGAAFAPASPLLRGLAMSP